jgi:hypothetical protein
VEFVLNSTQNNQKIKKYSGICAEIWVQTLLFFYILFCFYTLFLTLRNGIQEVGGSIPLISTKKT